MSDEVEGGTEQSGAPNPFEGLGAADILPEEFLGRDPAEVKVLLSQMPRIVRAQKEELENLRVQMAGGGGATVTHGAPAPAPKKSEEELRAEFEEEFDKNPMAAIKRFVQEEFGGVVQGLNSRVGETEFTLVKQSIPDFGEFEDDVRGLLRQSGAPATQENIVAAYKMALGDRMMQVREQKIRAAASSPPATPAPEDEEPEVQLSALQQEVARSMGLSDEEYAKYSDTSSFQLNIRT